MGRDIITVADVAALREAVAAARSGEVTGAGGRKLGPAGGGLGEMPSPTTEVPRPDSWNQRLLKFIPGEAIGLYLALDRAVHSVGELQGDAQRFKLAFWLAVVLAISALFNVLYLRLVWRVQRYTQISASTLALAAYVYAVGGAFEPVGLADPAVQMIVVILVATFLVFFKPPGQAVDVGNLS